MGAGRTEAAGERDVRAEPGECAMTGCGNERIDIATSTPSLLQDSCETYARKPLTD